MQKKSYTATDEAARQLVLDAMAQHRWKPGDVAAVVERSPDVVRRWLRGERTIPLDAFLRITRACDLSLLDVPAELGGRGSAASRHRKESSLAEEISSSIMALSGVDAAPVVVTIRIERAAEATTAVTPEPHKTLVSTPDATTAHKYITPVARQTLTELNASISDEETRKTIKTG